MIPKTISIVGSADVKFNGLGIPHPYSNLLQHLQKNGFKAATAKEADYLVAFNHNQSMYKAFVESGGEPKRTVLLRLEPETVFPSQYKSSTVGKYGLIITPGGVLNNGNRKSGIGWPYQYHLNPATPKPTDPTLDSILESPSHRILFEIQNWRNRPITLSLIAANKVSPLGKTNYSLRRKLAKEISKDTLQVYGPLWQDSLARKVHHRIAVCAAALRQRTMPHPIGIYGSLFSQYPTAKGAIENKHEVLQKSKFSLVVENSNSYVSEKLFDVMLNGAIPIYVGLELQEVGLPPEIAIHSSGDPHEIVLAVKTLSESDAEAILKAGRDFFDSVLFRYSWSEGSVYSRIADQISLYFAELKL